MDYILLILWFIFLIKWADILVDWSSSIAKKYNVSSLVIWLTIVAFGTSAPEFIVSMLSAFDWNSDISISNVVWSNISNILLILWVTAFLYPIKMPHTTVRNEIPFLILITLAFSVLLLDNYISRLDATLLIVFFIWFLYYTFKISKQNSDEENEIKIMSGLKATIFIILWLIWLIGWGKMIVDSAVSIASAFWVPNSFIWVTIIAIWTSLPELAASIVAAFKKNTDMAIGWVVWSNIFNTLWIIGWTWVVLPLWWYASLNFDLWINFLAVLLILLFAFTYKRNFLDKKEGIVLFSFYIFYISYLVYNLKIV